MMLAFPPAVVAIIAIYMALVKVAVPPKPKLIVWEDDEKPLAPITSSNSYVVEPWTVRAPFAVALKIACADVLFEKVRELVSAWNCSMAEIPPAPPEKTTVSSTGHGPRRDCTGHPR